MQVQTVGWRATLRAQMGRRAVAREREVRTKARKDKKAKGKEVNAN